MIPRFWKCRGGKLGLKWRSSSQITVWVCTWDRGRRPLRVCSAGFWERRCGSNYGGRTKGRHRGRDQFAKFSSERQGVRSSRLMQQNRRICSRWGRLRQRDKNRVWRKRRRRRGRGRNLRRNRMNIFFGANSSISGDLVRRCRRQGGVCVVLGLRVGDLLVLHEYISTGTFGGTAGICLDRNFNQGPCWRWGWSRVSRGRFCWRRGAIWSRAGDGSFGGVSVGVCLGYFFSLVKVKLYCVRLFVTSPSRPRAWRWFRRLFS